MKKIAVILAGCGVNDGSEIHEAVITLLSIDRQGAHYQCFAPDIPQHHVINHLTGEEIPEKRNILVEAARIARGHILSLDKLNADDFDAIVIPGGFGVAKNLCNFAFKGSDLEIQPAVKQAVQAFIHNKKPVGLICIAPAMTGKLFEKNTIFTIGHNQDTAKAIEKTGATHKTCDVNNIVVDEKNKLVTTPAYMEAKRISEVEQGVSKLIEKVISLI